MGISNQNQAVFNTLGWGSQGIQNPWGGGANRMTYDDPAPAAGSGGAAAGGSNARVDDARTKMFGLANDRLNSLKNDPVDAAIQAKLMGRVNGSDLPYNETTTNAMMTNSAAQAAQAMKSRAGHVAGNPNDPSYQARMDELNSDRQGAVQSARLNIDQNANLANYDAQGTAVNSLNSFNAGRQGRLTGASNTLEGMYGQEYATGPGFKDGSAGAGGGGNSIQMVGGQSGTGGNAYRGDSLDAEANALSAGTQAYNNQRELPVTGTQRSPGAQYSARTDSTPAMSVPNAPAWGMSQPTPQQQQGLQMPDWAQYQNLLKPYMTR